MQPLMNCTTEELVFLLSMCGYHDMAKSLGESVLGEKSQEGWDTVMEGAAHQLMLKGIWNLEKASRDEIPLADELVSFIEDYATSVYLVRFMDRENGRSLLFHQISDQYWIYHQVINDIIHIFGRIETIDTLKEVDAFFGFSADAGMAQEVTLTPDQFDQLTDSTQVEPLRKELAIVMDEERLAAFDQFVFGLSVHDWLLKSGSTFVIGNQEPDLYMNDVFFFLPSPNGIWLVLYELEEGKQQVKITKKSRQEWLETAAVLFRAPLSV